MKIEPLLVEMIEEFDYYIVHRSQSRVIFKTRNAQWCSNQFIMLVKGTDINISRVKELRNDEGQLRGWVPETRVLLSIDLHDPRSLKDIRNWLKTLG